MFGVFIPKSINRNGSAAKINRTNHPIIYNGMNGKYAPNNRSARAIEEWIPHTDGNGKLTEAVPCEVTNAMPSLMVVYVPRKIPCLKQYMQHGQNNLINIGEVL